MNRSSTDLDSCACVTRIIWPASQRRCARRARESSAFTGVQNGVHVTRAERMDAVLPRRLQQHRPHLGRRSPTCTGDNLMLACRPTGSGVLSVVAHAPRADVVRHRRRRHAARRERRRLVLQRRLLVGLRGPGRHDRPEHLRHLPTSGQPASVLARRQSPDLGGWRCGTEHLSLNSEPVVRARRLSSRRRPEHLRRVTTPTTTASAGASTTARRSATTRPTPTVTASATPATPARSTPTTTSTATASAATSTATASTYRTATRRMPTATRPATPATPAPTRTTTASATPTRRRARSTTRRCRTPARRTSRRRRGATSATRRTRPACRSLNLVPKSTGRRRTSGAPRASSIRRPRRPWRTTSSAAASSSRCATPARRRSAPFSFAAADCSDRRQGWRQSSRTQTAAR